jgi:ATP-dependent helicase HrpA
MQKFGKELAFVRRYHKIPAEYERAALAFGGRDAVERAIEASLAREAFERNIRTEAEYKSYEAELGRTLFEKGHALTQTVVKILELNQAIRSELAKGSRGLTSAEIAKAGAAGGRPRKTINIYELDRLKETVVPAYFGEITKDLDKLLPKDFIKVCPVDRIVRIPRQLEAMKIRLARARLDPEKDKAKAAQVEPYEQTLERLETELAASESGAVPAIPGKQFSFPDYGARPGSGRTEIRIVSSNLEKRRAVEELRRMVEEFKISLFAPEIKTAFPISAVRLSRKIKEIEALV